MAEKQKRPKQLQFDFGQNVSSKIKQGAQKKSSKPAQSDKKRQDKTKATRKAEIRKSHTVQPRPKTKKIEPPQLGKRKGYRTPFASRLLLFLLVFMILTLFWVWFYTYRHVQPESEDIQRTVIAVTIEPGMTARSVSQLLEQVGVITDYSKLLSYFVAHDLATVIRSGSYLMDASMSFEQIADVLTSMPDELSLTIPPAFTIQSIDRYLVNRLGLKEGSFIKATEDLAIAYGLSFSEGWLLSGTYTVNRKRAAADLALHMYNSMLAELTKHLGSDLLQYYSVEDLLIVASMIQAETQNPQQMPLISSVIHNRLKNGEPLGIDATTR
ncbi:MAG: hypothetical protein EOM15_08595, partial [Spirochaetia bacterium]|nr:hypothetical protein [Spirochaetia bacterium]